MNMFKGAMLSSWNSVYGPKIEYIWFLNNHPLCYLPPESCTSIKYFDTIKDRYSILNVYKNSNSTPLSQTESINFPLLVEKVLNSFEDVHKFLKMSGKLLLTELETKRPFTTNCTRVYQLENKTLFSVIFYKQIAQEQSKDENMCLSLSVMIACDNLSFSFKLQNILDLYLRFIVSTIQKSQFSKQLMSVEITKHFEHVCKAINEVYCEKVPINECSTRFSQFQLREKFLNRAIVSHMQTSGCSLVVGGSKYTVNQISVVLLQFNTEKERLCSSPLVQVSEGVFYRGLQVQGHVKDYIDNHGLTLPEEYYNQYSITIIDTDSYKVRQSLNNSMDNYDSQSLKTVVDSGKLIPKFLQDVFLFEEHKWPIKSLLDSLQHSINIKAAMLIKLIENYRNEGSVVTEKQLMSALDVSNTADFRIYVGYAEKLKPRIKVSII